MPHLARQSLGWLGSRGPRPWVTRAAGGAWQCLDGFPWGSWSWIWPLTMGLLSSRSSGCNPACLNQDGELRR